MKHKTAELTGALLDEAVALALGATVTALPALARDTWGLIELQPCAWLGEVNHYDAPFRPSEWHAHGGPIIERERIALVGWHGKWDAAVNGFVDIEGGITSDPPGGRAGEAEDAPSPLIAAMRAFVASKLGDEVELP